MKKKLCIFLFSIVWAFSHGQDGACFKPAKLKHRKANYNKGFQSNSKLTTSHKSSLANSHLKGGFGIGNAMVDGIDFFYSLESQFSQRIYMESELGLSYINTNDFTSSYDYNEMTLGGYLMCNPRIYLSYTNKELAGKSTAHFPGLFMGLKLALWYYPALHGNSTLYSLGPNLGYRSVFNERLILEGSLGLAYSNLADQTIHYNNFTHDYVPEFNASLIYLIF